jgi:hypothetical protein
MRRLLGVARVAFISVSIGLRSAGFARASAVLDLVAAMSDGNDLAPRAFLTCPSPRVRLFGRSRVGSVVLLRPSSGRKLRQSDVPKENAMNASARTAVAALAFAIGASLSPAFAEVIKYKATLSAADEVPPKESAGKGSIEASYDTTTKMLTWSGTYSDLTGPETAAHFHGPAMAGKNAGVLVPVDAKTSPFKGSATLTDDVAKDFAEGMVYFNVHTEKNKGGEIRGQIAEEK